MKLSKEDKAYLNSFKHNTDNSNVRFKEIVKKVLLENKYLLHVIHNVQLEDSGAEMDEYYNTSILPYFLIAATQHNVANFLCYDVGFHYTSRDNQLVRQIEVTFYILCHQDDIIEKETGIARHDLIAALILDEFDWSNHFGFQIHCVSDLPTVTDNNYMTRTLIFRGEYLTSIVKNRNGRPKVINSEVKQIG